VLALAIILLHVISVIVALYGWYDWVLSDNDWTEGAI
jgi:hypothetical protein